ncbi:ARM repeat superfamily protein [Euphorbia peplus]|nr:ARM repeat superfamily protein [Euphorbia peplus]
MEQEEAQIWKSDSMSSNSVDSMVSVSIGRAIATLLASRAKKLPDSISRLTTKRPSLGSLDDSLWLLHKFVKDAAERDQNLDDILIPILQHSLRTKDTKHGGQCVVLVNWLFQDEVLFECVARNLGEVIARKSDRYVALGWCVLVRNVVEYESFVDQYSLNGIRDNYNSLLKIFCSYVPKLTRIVCEGSTLQEGFEFPSRLSVSAADCILSISEALTKKAGALSRKPKSLEPNSLNKSGSIFFTAVEEKKVKPACVTFDGSNFDGTSLLWNLVEELSTLLQRLIAWSRKSRPLHAKGAEQVLKWLREIKGHHSYIQDARTGVSMPRTGAFLLSSCWKHYSNLLHLEDRKFTRHWKELLDQYISGIQYYIESQAEGQIENKNAGAETIKFFLNCVCLLLGRFGSNKFESIMSEYGMQISRILLSQLRSADEDVIAGAVSIFKEVIFRPNCSAGDCDPDNRQTDTVLPLLLSLLDEQDGVARAAVMLVSEYCSITTNDSCLKEVLKRLATGNAQQRRNAIDVVSQLVHMSSTSTKKLSHFAWQDITNQLLECLNDEQLAICQQASNLLSVIDPSSVLPALVYLICSSDEVQLYACSTFTAMLKYNNQKPEVICMVLDCLSNLSPSLDHLCNTESKGSKGAIERVFKLIPEWSKSVQNWNSLVGPLIDKMFAEPENATIIRFLSCISDHLEGAADTLLSHVLLHMKTQKRISKDLISGWESRSITSEDSVKMKQLLFERLSPLLIVRLLPLKVFSDPNLHIMYGEPTTDNITQVSEYGEIEIVDECVASFLLQRALSKHEFEDVRKLAAELCGRVHPKILFPIVSSVLECAIESHQILQIKACLFSICTSLVVRCGDSAFHPVTHQIRKTIQEILLWPSLDGDEVSKAQHGCIDCLALMICAEQQALQSSQDSTLGYVVHQLTNDNKESPVSISSNGNCELETPFPLSFRLCMANSLISACQKISDSAKKPFAETTIPKLISSAEMITDPEIRAACVQVLFSAVYHLKCAVLPYSPDLLRISLRFLQKGTEKERMSGAKLMTSLMGSEETILGNIAGGLVEARQALTSISSSDMSHDLQKVCKNLLACLTFS